MCGTDDDGVYCGLLPCQKKHAIHHMNKSNILSTGIYILKRDNLNHGCIECISIWNKKQRFDTRDPEYTVEVKPYDLRPDPFLDKHISGEE